MANQKLHVAESPISWQRRVHPDGLSHNLYRVTLKNGEKWAIDVTGAQFGYPEPLCPWQDYIMTRVKKIKKEQAFGAVRRDFSTNGAMQVRPEKLELAKMLEDKITEWAGEYGPGGLFNAILNGSDAAFKAARDKFLNVFNKHVNSSMIEVFSPKNVARRVEEHGGPMMRLLRQNRAMLARSND
jgi:hypothetical protein